MGPRLVLFVCVENAGRSLMAEALFNAHAPAGWRAVSAGTEPAAAPNPRVAAALRELGLTLPDHPPQRLTQEMIESASVHVTMGCLDRASCPARLKAFAPRDWSLPDPARLDDEGLRRVRDNLRDRVEELRRELAAADEARPPTASPSPS